jgi:hypothetical protein
MPCSPTPKIASSPHGDLKYNITRASSDLKDFFTPPDVVVSFGGGNLSEMIQMGFRKDSQGRRAFYRGSLSKDKIPSILDSLLL